MASWSCALDALAALRDVGYVIEMETNGSQIDYVLYAVPEEVSWS